LSDSNKEEAVFFDRDHTSYQHVPKNILHILLSNPLYLDARFTYNVEAFLQLVLSYGVNLDNRVELFPFTLCHVYRLLQHCYQLEDAADWKNLAKYSPGFEPIFIRTFGNYWFYYEESAEFTRTIVSNIRDPRFYVHKLNAHMFVVRTMLQNVTNNESRSQILLAVANYMKNLCQYDYGL
jgi:hypothetical protein